VPIEKTLQRVDALIAAGDLEGARTRLVSLVDHAPRRLDVRERLAEVNRRSGNRQEAGRWGYLSEQTDRAELRAFTKAHRGDARSMMKALRWQGPEDGTGSGVAEERLRALRATAEDDAGGRVDWEDPKPEPSRDSPWGIAVTVLVLGFLLASLVVGAITILRWLVGLVW
jgi:hypothetical protein